MRVFLLLFMAFGLVFGLDSESSESNSESSLDSELLDRIRAADSIFYKGVSTWSSNADEASSYLKKACDSAHPGACLYLGNYYEVKAQQNKTNKSAREQSQKQAQDYYKKGYENSIEACKQGGIEWCSIQAIALFDGRGVEKNIERGIEFLEILCDSDIEQACFSLGSYYFFGTYMERDLIKAKELSEKALRLDSKACDERRLYACVLSAEIYQQGLGVGQDFVRSKEYFSRACELQNQFACDYVHKLK